ncbi:MAG TPA: hypothetical protein P5119_12640 [Candidatus Aminicenantes bacterium]|nr:hypothetical protein [Candidatus Aminicenantes bacterium]HRY66173.1 hypothetical protein [Candidatus Aminicenantes bacterium]HRZ73087.1 hypothetical protein [Candidatus Aminicenantes bacterium]
MRKTSRPKIASSARQKNGGPGLILLFVGVLLAGPAGRADFIEYNQAKNILIENKDIRVFHHHDWSSDRERRRKIMSSRLGPFQPENTYAYVECISQKAGRALFNKPSPALTFLWISDDSEYIVGLSNIRVDNPIQLVVFDKSGRLLKKRSISSWEAELAREEYAQFVRQFPSAAASLASRSGIVNFHDKVYIDPLAWVSTGHPKEAWEYIVAKRAASHFSANFSESVMNWVFWYKSEGPEIRLRYDGENLAGISLLDPKGQRFEIPIVEEFRR